MRVVGRLLGPKVAWGYTGTGRGGRGLGGVRVKKGMQGVDCACVCVFRNRQCISKCVSCTLSKKALRAAFVEFLFFPCYVIHTKPLSTK